MAKKVINKANEKYNLAIKKIQNIFNIYKEANARAWILDTDIIIHEIDLLKI